MGQVEEEYRVRLVRHEELGRDVDIEYNISGAHGKVNKSFVSRRLLHS